MLSERFQKQGGWAYTPATVSHGVRQVIPGLGSSLDSQLSVTVQLPSDLDKPLGMSTAESHLQLTLAHQPVKGI